MSYGYYTPTKTELREFRYKDGTNKLYDSARKGKYFTSKGKRVYLEDCSTFQRNGETVYFWSDILSFETVVRGDYAETDHVYFARVKVSA